MRAMRRRRTFDTFAITVQRVSGPSEIGLTIYRTDTKVPIYLPWGTVSTFLRKVHLQENSLATDDR